MMCKGFVKIPCSLFDTRWWSQSRTFSESEAIIDIYQSADKENMIVTSIRELADRWRWDNHTKVLRFLSRLEQEGYIKVTKSTSGTTIRILENEAGATLSATPTATPKSLFPEVFQEVSATPTATPSATPKRKSSGGFVKPTVQEIEDYCKEKGYRMDAQHFWDFYESKGWVVGKAPMKKWRNAVANWMRSEYRKQSEFEMTQLRNNDDKHKYDGGFW